MLIQGVVGAPSASFGAGSNPPMRQGQLGDIIASELHGRFYEQTYRGQVYSIGTLAVTALSANTITLTASTTPILGVWNPASSTANVVILQAGLVTFLNNVTSVAPGGYVWASSVGNANISTGVTPFNRKTLTNAGSQAKGFAGATALTGLTNNLVIFEGADFAPASGLLTTTVSAATPTPAIDGVHNFDGAIIVPPGGILALLNTASTTTHSFLGKLIWEEVPL
jgi:hypothetical protein